MLDQHNGGCLALEDSVLVPPITLTAASSTTPSATRELTDFEWDIVRKAGYPIFPLPILLYPKCLSILFRELRPVRTELSNISGRRLSGGL
jgi:hypothetical protein